MAVMVVHVEVGEPTTGLWCPRCNLPSGYEAPLYTMWDSGIGRIGTLRRCHDCDHPLDASVEDR